VIFVSYLVSFSGSLRSCVARIGFFLLALAPGAFAQLQLEPPPSPPPTPRDRGLIQPMPMPLPMPRQFPLDQLAPPTAPPATGTQTPRATASFEPSTVRLMRFGEYRVTIAGANTSVELPDPLPAPEGLVVELSNRSQSISILNGQRVSSVTFHYSVTAARPGVFLMPSFTATVAGVAVTVPAAQVRVQEPRPDDLPYQGAHAVIDLPDREYYVGQTIQARLLVIETPDEGVQGIANVTKPSGDFLFQSQPGIRKEQVNYKGRMVGAMVTGLRLTPIKPGDTEISIQAIVFISKLSMMGRQTGSTAQAMLDTPPVTVRVRSLPEKGRKPGFTGGIGNFELGRPSVSASEVIVGDPLTLTVTVSGDGNLEALSPPAIPDDETWQSFTPTSDVTRDPISGRGTKSMTYTLVPRSPNARAIPSIPFSVFDPERGEYVDLSIPPVPVVVKQGSAPTSAASPQPATDPAASEPPAAKSPEPILTGLAEKIGPTRSTPAPVAWHTGFWAGQLLPAGALMGLWLWRRRVDYLAAHPEVVRRREARIAARNHLRAARSAAQSRSSDEFVRASIDAIRAAAAPLDSTQAGSLVLSEVLSNLPDETQARAADSTVRRLFERAHTTRYSGHMVDTDGVFALLPEVERTVAAIEKHQP
jgi:hypothetical protein